MMKKARISAISTGKTFLRRSIGIPLALLLLLGGTACKTEPTTEPVVTTATSMNTTSSVEETAITTSETKKYPDDLPDNIDLQKTTIRIASRTNKRYANEFSVDALTGEIVNDALYMRNARVEERLNCTIQNDQISGSDDNHGPVLNGLETQLLAGDCEYDVIAGSMYWSMVHASNGYYLDLMQYLDIIDIEKPYWSTKFIEQAMINNKLYTLTGDAALTTRQSAFMMVFNKELADVHQMGDLYELVRSGKWTIDKLLELTANVYQDLNNDGVRGAEDMYGYSVSNRVGADQWVNALDIKFFQKDADGKLKICLDQDKFFSAYDKVYKLYYENGGTYAYPYKGGDLEMEEIMNCFANDQLIFATNWLRGLEYQSIRNMDNKFGVLPSPKYDEAQSDYYTFMHDQLTVLSIPLTVSADRAEGVVAPFLEAFAAESHQSVIPQYYEVALKCKLVDAPEDAEMLDIISEGIYVDFVWMCRSSDQYLKQVLRDGIMNKYSSVTALLNAKIKAAEKSMSKFTALFE